MSPVRNQPSRNAAAVSSGRCQYSRNTAGPRTSSSPGVPSGTSMPSSSTRRTSTPGSGWPTHPGRRSPCERVRQRHADLGHAVALEQRVAADLAPAFEHVHRQRRRPDIIRRSRRTPAERAACSRGRRVPRRDQPAVDRRHGGEHGDLARRQPRPHRVGVEGRQDLARGAHRQRRAEPVDDAVHVVQRQHEQQAIRRPPLPRPRPAPRPARRRSACVVTAPFGLPVVPLV